MATESDIKRFATKAEAEGWLKSTGLRGWAHSSCCGDWIAVTSQDGRVYGYENADFMIELMEW